MIRAYRERADVALGYGSWDAYTRHEFGAIRLRLPLEERGAAVGSLRDAGLSIRAIASATGLGHGTVQREIEAAAVPGGTADKPTVTGIDRKGHPARKPAKQPKATEAAEPPVPEPKPAAPGEG